MLYLKNIEVYFMEWLECGNALYNYPRIELAGCVLRGFQVELQDSSARAAMPKCVAMPTGQADLQQKSKNLPCSSRFCSEFLFVRGHVNCTERVMALNFCVPQRLGHPPTERPKMWYLQVSFWLGLDLSENPN